MEWHFGLKQQEENNNGGHEDEESVDYSSQSQARTPLFNRNKSPPPSDDAAGVGGQSQGRFFFPNYVKLINSLLSGAPAIATTSMSTITFVNEVTITLSFTTTKTCFAKTLFSDDLLLPSPPLCSSKRRRNAEIIDAIELLASQENLIQPSKTEM